MKSTELFSDKSEVYHKYRPNYSSCLVEYLYKGLCFTANSCIADVGSGTGLFSKMLLEQGSRVFGIEPNDSMRIIADKTLKDYTNYISVKASGENTTLVDNSVDNITVAQSFHWLDIVRFKLECKRIMKQNGKIVIIYNRKRRDSDVNLETAKVIKKYYPNYKNAIDHWEIRENSIIKFFKGSNFDLVSFENNIINTFDEFIGRSLSASYAKPNKQFIDSLSDLFFNFARNGIITIPNDTIAYVGTVLS